MNKNNLTNHLPSFLQTLLITFKKQDTEKPTLPNHL